MTFLKSQLKYEQLPYQPRSLSGENENEIKTMLFSCPKLITCMSTAFELKYFTYVLAFNWSFARNYIQINRMLFNCCKNFKHQAISENVAEIATQSRRYSFLVRHAKRLKIEIPHKWWVVVDYLLIQLYLPPLKHGNIHTIKEIKGIKTESE